MKTTLSTLFLALGLAAGLGLGTSAAHAGESASKPAVRHNAKAAKKHSVKKEEKDDNRDDDGQEVNLAGSTTVDLQCDMGSKVILYENNADSKHVALRWGKRLHRMEAVDTTTGAKRFENKKAGLVWIGIPAKGMLLDSRHGHQLANGCRDAAQIATAKNAPGGAGLLDEESTRLATKK